MASNYLTILDLHRGRACLLQIVNYIQRSIVETTNPSEGNIFRTSLNQLGSQSNKALKINNGSHCRFYCSALAGHSKQPQIYPPSARYCFFARSMRHDRLLLILYGDADP